MRDKILAFPSLFSQTQLPSLLSIPRLSQPFAGHAANCALLLIKDAECYSILLGQIAGEAVGMVNVGRALREKDTLKRAQMVPIGPVGEPRSSIDNFFFLPLNEVVDMADTIHCKKFITPRDIVEVSDPKLLS